MLSNYRKNMSESNSKRLLEQNNAMVTRGQKKGFSNDDMASLFSMTGEQHGTGPLDKAGNNASMKDVNQRRM